MKSKQPRQLPLETVKRILRCEVHCLTATELRLIADTDRLSLGECSIANQELLNRYHEHIATHHCAECQHRYEILKGRSNARRSRSAPQESTVYTS